MLKNFETVFFFLATVGALALPAVPALQEALTTGENTLEAALPTVTMERVIVTAPAPTLPQQVALVR
jgi:hypothetical protein